MAFFVIEFDVLSKDIRVVLSQERRHIAFFSKALALRHQMLSVYENKMMAVLVAVKKWNSYMIVRHFQIKKWPLQPQISAGSTG